MYINYFENDFEEDKSGLYYKWNREYYTFESQRNDKYPKERKTFLANGALHDSDDMDMWDERDYSTNRLIGQDYTELRLNLTDFVMQKFSWIYS